MDLKRYIRDVPDFPKPGILFRDIAPLLASPEGFSRSIQLCMERISGENITAILAIESRGFLFSAPLALELGLPLVLARKAGKLPGECISVEYGLEYGSAKLDMQVDALTSNDSVLVVDDVLATGGTAVAASSLVEKVGAKVACFLFLIELSFLRGREKLPGVCHSLIEY